MIELDVEARDALYSYLRWQRMGIPPHDGSLRRWPARLVDIMDLFRIEYIRFENAEAEARRLD